MARELESVDIGSVPELLRIAEEVRQGGEPRLLRRGEEDIAVLMPLSAPARRASARAKASSQRGTPRFTIESAAGSVRPPTRTEDIEAMIQDAKEEHAERMMAKLRRR